VLRFLVLDLGDPVLGELVDHGVQVLRLRLGEAATRAAPDYTVAK
jgi:hypothetical protein